MIINHNMNAMNAHRNMGINNTQAGKSMEKLSSGLRINRAGDDAAGLAISEKMRGQIRGLDQASRNAQDGISMIQTAEGALNETHNILQRMRELSVQGANDTNTSDDRTAITEELNQLTEEIDRIKDTTEFNGQTLLDGTFSGAFQIGANSSQKIDLSIDGMGSTNLGLTSGVTLTATVNVGTKLADGDYSVKAVAAGTSNLLDSKGNTVGTINAAGLATLSGGATINLGHKINDGAQVKIDSKVATVTLGKGTGNAGALAAGEYKVSGTDLLNGDRVVGSITGGTITLNDKNSTQILASDLGLVAGDITTGKSFSVGGVDVTTANRASGSLTTLDDAIKNVSTQRSKLGAVQNRLEHTTANLNNTSENLTAAESRIRDVDMAKEMLNFSKNNILNQAAQSMLAQAKSQPEGVLQLLR